MDTVRNKQEMSGDEIELYKKDLIWQMSFEEIDWDYVIDTARAAKRVQEKLLEEGVI